MSPLTRSSEPVRELDAEELGIGANAAIAEHSSNQADDSPLADDDPLYLEVRGLLNAFGGVIFTGPPGTSKTYFAHKIATKLADGDSSRVRWVQFHPSYQYEDFMQGFVPKKSGDGFELVPKHFMAMCQQAELADDDEWHVLVIDELSRGDPGRIFGEALTYVERSKRGLPCDLASGDVITVPKNLAILATMNPLDRGVDEVDAAFERRFAKIAMNPSRPRLIEILDANGLDPDLRDRLLTFFSKVNGFAERTPQAAMGHTFFADVTDAESLQSVWDHQLSFLIEKAFRLYRDTIKELTADFAMVVAAPGPVAASNEPETATPGE